MPEPKRCPNCDYAWKTVTLTDRARIKCEEKMRTEITRKDGALRYIKGPYPTSDMSLVNRLGNIQREAEKALSPDSGKWLAERDKRMYQKGWHDAIAAEDEPLKWCPERDSDGQHFIEGGRCLTLRCKKPYKPAAIRREGR